MASESDTPGSVNATVEFGAGPWHIRTQVTVPAGRTRLRQMLPLVQALSDSMVNAVCQDSEQHGHSISCKKGCGACCRQMVPISQVEAHALHDLVEQMPEPRRRLLRTRFAEAVRRLGESGLLDMMRERARWTDEEYRAASGEYFQQHIACPFLEDESCSIHPQRPISCREYLVSSPAENCAQPTAGSVQTLRMPFQMWWALARFDPPPADTSYVPWVPLILALDWAKEHPEEEAGCPGPELVAELFAKLTSKERVVPSGGHLE